MRALAAALILWAGAATAETPAEAAGAAFEQLRAAEAQLDAAKSGKTRVAALSETVRAYEAGLAAVRAGLRDVTVRERQLSLELAGQEGEVAQLLTLLQARGRVGSPTLFMHPEGALGTARAGMIVAEMTPALNARAEALRETLLEVSTLRQLQASAEGTLQDGLDGVQSARTQLSQSIADRVPLPKKFTEDSVQKGLLLASAETLDAFANNLGMIGGEGGVDSAADIDLRKGQLALPVAGQLLRRAGEADAAGVVRAGMLIATRPRSLVSSPSAATIRYVGPLLDLANVIILEPRAGLLLVFAGLDVVYGEIGDVIAEGAPLGLMGGQDAALGEILLQVENGAGSDLSETLYLEVREENEPVNPELWFRTGKEE